LFVDIARYIVNTKPRAEKGDPDPLPSRKYSQSAENGDAHQAKKRKIGEDGDTGTMGLRKGGEDTVSLLRLPDTSFSVPMRKKMVVEFYGGGDGAKGAGGVEVKGADGTVVNAFGWSDVGEWCISAPFACCGDLW